MRFGAALWVVFWSNRERRFATGLTVAYLLVLLVPFAVIGETWGMVWYYLALPSSELSKDLWDWFGAVPYVGLVTMVNGMMAFMLIHLFFSLGGRIGRPTPTPGGGERPRPEPA
jgi:hypothetical protein